MRFSRALLPTLREDPVEATVVSHRLMLRAGLIRQLGAGIYTWLPLGLRVLRRVEAIVREEMDAAGAMEVLMPSVQPAELWQESGRWQHYGKELLRFKDRLGRDYCLGPTHEEVITDLVRGEVRSYRQLPLTCYQIQAKFRDEIRPRFGVMRGREFLMKDAYSFDLDEDSLERSYQGMVAAYERIFRRCGLDFRAVEADTGAIGGAYSHEFHVLAASGEDTIVSCDQCGYAANLEKAVAALPACPPGELGAMLLVATPGVRTIEEVAALLGVGRERLVKTLVVATERGMFRLLVRGDQVLNEVKAMAALGVVQLNLLDPGQVEAATQVPVGFLGPVGGELPVVADLSLAGMAGFICGANREGWHQVGVNWGRDLPLHPFADLRSVAEGEGCGRCPEGRLRWHRGIEVGHVFKLGDKYSRAMGMTVVDPQGQEVVPLMGCYGIGVSRIVGAAVEQNHDEDGICWPLAIAPFQVIIALLNLRDAQGVQAAETLYRELQAAGVSVLLDDREERAGVKFKDADLLGIPLRVVVGGRLGKSGQVEVRHRRDRVEQGVRLAEACNYLHNQLVLMAKAESK